MTLKFQFLVWDRHNNVEGLNPFIHHSKLALHNSKKDCVAYEYRLLLLFHIFVYRYALTLETTQLAKLQHIHMSHTIDH